MTYGMLETGLVWLGQNEDKLQPGKGMRKLLPDDAWLGSVMASFCQMTHGLGQVWLPFAR
jgi:hypothetical protein